MQEEELFTFRSDEQERLAIAERNKQAAASILSQAGISEDNPLYNQYYAHTLANVHHAGRYGGYDKQIEQMFVETLQDPELSLEQYIEASKRFEAQFAEKQMQNAEGSVFNEAKNNTPFQEMRGILNKTTLDGVEMRKNQNTTFPKEFYDENGSLKRRLVVEIPPELMGNSAMGAIGTITKEYKNISFDRASNSFMVKGRPIGPEKFFKNKKELLDKFDAEKLDMSDTELLGVLQEGDYNKFLELRKNRGMNRDRRNEMLRNVLNDEVVLGEVSKKFRNTELNKQNISDVVKSVAEDFGSKAQIVRIESEKATLGGIDRVMFSVSPADVARQSTFQDWKSCMHAVGCNHQYVDDSIGVGSIIAYGYSSDDPQKMVSRLLIHPYTSNKGTVAYGVNDRIYGKENLAFREVVNKVVTEKFNAGKVGAFKLNENLYNDNAGKNVLRLFPADMKNVDWYDFVVDGVLDLHDCYGINLVGADLSQVKGLTLPDDIKSLEGIKLPKRLDLSNCSELNLSGADFSQVEDLTPPNDIKSLKEIKLSSSLKRLDLSKCSELNLNGTDLSHFEGLKLPNNIKSLVGITFPKKLDLNNCSELSLNGADLSQVEDLKLPNNIKSLEGTKFPKKLDLSNCYNVSLSGVDLFQVEDLKLPRRIESLEGIKLPSSLKCLDLSSCNNINLAGADLSQVEELKLPNNIKSLEGTKFPKKLDLSNCYNVSLSGVDLSQVEEVKFPRSIESLDDIKLPKKLDLSNCSELSLNGADLSQVEDLILPDNIGSLEGIKLPSSLKRLDLSNCYNVNLAGVDLSQVEEVKFPRSIESLDDIKLPKKLDLTNCWKLNLNGADLSQVEEVKFHRSIESLEGTKFPKEVNFSGCWKLNLARADLSQVEKVKFPRNIESLEGTKFPKKVDLSNCWSLNLAGADLSQVEKLELPRNIESLEGTKFPKKVDLRNCDNVNLVGADLSQVEDLKLPSSIESLEGTKFPKQVDFSNCYDINLAGADLSQVEDLKLPSSVDSLKGVKLPKKLDISSCYNLSLEGADLSAVENLKVSSCENMNLSNFSGKLEFSQRNIGIMNSKLPPSMKSLDLSDRMAFISETNLDGIEELKLPEHVIVKGMGEFENELMELCDGDERKLESMAVAVITPESVPNNLKRLDISACKDIDLRNWNLDKIEDLKLPKDFDVSKLPEGILERNPAVERAVKISRGEAVEDLVQTSVGKENAAVADPKAEIKPKNAAAERINRLRRVKQSSASVVEAKEVRSKDEVRQIILEKQGRVAEEPKTPVKSSQISNQMTQQKLIQQGRG